MTQRLSKALPFHPYPIAAGESLGYRCFDGKKWHDCDKNGKILIRRG